MLHEVLLDIVVADAWYCSCDNKANAAKRCATKAAEQACSSDLCISLSTICLFVGCNEMASEERISEALAIRKVVEEGRGSCNDIQYQCWRPKSIRDL
jgi:hypothetical protein